LATLMGSHNYTDLLYNICVVLGPFLIISLFGEQYRNDIIMILWGILTLYLLINLVTIIVYPNGLSRSYKEGVYQSFGRWFLGGENVIGAVSLPLSIYGAVLYKKEKRFVYLFSVILSLGTVFWTNSATSIIGGVIVGAYIIIKTISDKVRANKEQTGKMILRVAILAIIFLFILIVLLNGTNIFSGIISNIFHKNLTLSGRFYVWNRVIELIKQRPILGYGFNNSQDNLGLIGNAHAHDYYLNILYTGGVLSLIVWLMMIIKTIRHALLNFGNEEVRLLSFGIIAFLFMFLTEVYDPLYISGFYFMLFLLFYY